MGKVLLCIVMLMGCGDYDGDVCDYTTEHGMCIILGEYNHPTADEVEKTTRSVIDWMVSYHTEEESKSVIIDIINTVVEYADDYTVPCGEGIVARACVDLPFPCEEGVECIQFPAWIAIARCGENCSIGGLLWHELGHVILGDMEVDQSEWAHHNWMCETGFEPIACEWLEDSNL